MKKPYESSLISVEILLKKAESLLLDKNYPVAESIAEELGGGLDCPELSAGLYMQLAAATGDSRMMIKARNIIMPRIDALESLGNYGRSAPLYELVGMEEQARMAKEKVMNDKAIMAKVKARISLIEKSLAAENYCE
jgi:hypothetical protein